MISFCFYDLCAEINIVYEIIAIVTNWSESTKKDNNWEEK